MLRDLEVHGRELLTVQVLGEVPPELRVTPERDARLESQAAAIGQADAVRLLELVSDALEATANGAQPRIQLELVLIKAAAPEVDPTTQALLARIERLERKLAGTVAPATAPATPPVAPGPVPRLEPVAPPEPEESAAPPLATELDEIVALWPAVIDITRSNAMLAALLERARPIAVSGQELTLGFPRDAAFMKHKAEQDENRRATAEALRNVTGAALQIRYELTEAGTWPDGAAAGVDQVLTEEELVRRFVEELDAQEIAEPAEEAD
jgi:DNA polymerase-3 subunit gamma/tau